jgi:hypothetical protein
MKRTLQWKRGTFSTTYRIFSGDKLLGELTDRTFKQTAHAYIGQKKYIFRTKGLFKQETSIIDGENDQTVGKIIYGSMMTKASIELPDRTLSWKYDNRWQTRWSIFDGSGTYMNFSGRSSGGSIEIHKEDELLVLTGLFVTNYYQQAMIAIFVAVFIPIWVTLFT